MSEGGPSEGSDQTQQPGVTPADIGEEVERVSSEDISIEALSDVAAPAGDEDDSLAMVNADLVDDPDDLARTIEEASGQKVEVVSEKELAEDDRG